MADIEKILKDIAAGGIGAVATIAEKGSELAKNLVEKGHEALEDNKDAVDNVKNAFSSVCDSVKSGLQDLSKVDFNKLSQDARDAIRKAIDDADAKAKEAAEKAADPVAEAAKDAVNEAAADIENEEHKAPVLEVKDDEEE